MQPQNQNANLLSIFSFIFAGIQGLALLFIGAYAIFMVVMLGMGIAQNPNSEIGVYIFSAFMAALFAFLAGFGAVNVWFNFKLGRMLRSSSPPSQKRVIVTSIFNFCSFLCGGVFIAPFGIALGVFGIVFANSEGGKAFLNGISTGQFLPPPPPTNFAETPHSMHDWR